jgi:NAD(P)-dependent dehydrogenase (short-subunit alcohol dehydrogenase family)
MPRLADKLCLVTGAARGIGLAIAQAFHAQGAQVIITDIDAEEGQAAADALGCRFITLDVSDEAAWDALEREVPHVDVLVNNAGITGLGDHGHKHDPENTPLSEWRRVHEINLDGTFLGCRYAIRAMKASGKGSIINMSSRSGLVGIPGLRPMPHPRRRSATIPNRWRFIARGKAGRSGAIRSTPPRS